jgi:hypothetical protein
MEIFPHPIHQEEEVNRWEDACDGNAEEEEKLRWQNM